MFNKIFLPFNRKKTEKILRILFVFFIVFAWIFSGWPQIWQKPAIPPKVQETKAAAIAQNIIVAWPYASSTIPSGWYRDTVLDGYFLLGTTTDPGFTGGALTHTHDAASHTHTQTNSHTHTGNPSTGAVVGTFNGTVGSTGSNLTGHTHTIPNLAAGTDSITATTSNIDTASNLPPYREMLWIYNADGSTEIPNGAIAFFANVSDVPASGWTGATTTGLFYRGAGVSTDPNPATQGSDTHSHTSSHDHYATKGAHASVTAPATTADSAAEANGSATIGISTHTHTVTSDTGTYTTGAADGNITASAVLPPYIGLVAAQNTGAADTPANVIAIWRGAIGFLPTNWNLCQSGGAVCNVDIADRFAMATTTANLLNTGGITSHSHSAGTHTHTTSHTHTLTIGQASAGKKNTASSNSLPTNIHTHASVTSAASSAADTDTATLTVNASTGETRPPFYGVAFLQYQVVSLTFIVSTDVFGSVTPGTVVFATSTLDVNTNNSTGWYVTLYGNNQGNISASTTMYLSPTNYATGIADQAEWIPGTATTTAGNAVRINLLDNSQNVLAFRIMTASGTPSFISTVWWGTTDNYLDSATTLWAGIASSTVQRQIGKSSVSSGGSNALNTVLYYLLVPSSQMSGNYTGDLTFTATTNP